MTTKTAVSLTNLLDPEILADPYPLYHRLRAEDPVHWDPYLHTWVVTRYADVLTVLHGFNADRTPSPEKLASIGLADLSPIADMMVKQMLFMDAPMHTRIRKLASYAFTPPKVAVLRDHVGDITESLLDTFESAGEIDVITELGDPLSCILTAEMLGVPAEDTAKLKEWSDDFAGVLGNFQHNYERTPKVRRSLEEMTHYFRAAIAEIERHPKPGLISSFLEANTGGDAFTADEMVANIIITLVGGQETTTNLVANGILTLLRNPLEHQRLLDDPSLIPSAVEEMLRYESPIQQTARLAPADRMLGDKLIRKGEAVIAVIGAANRDPERFPDPDRFDVAREDNRHLAFGWGPHFCFGAALGRIQGHVVFESVLRRFPNMRGNFGELDWKSKILGYRGLTSLRIAAA